MPDRPAGAVEGADAPDAGALEAMMAAVLFRPAPMPAAAGSTVDVEAVAASSPLVTADGTGTSGAPGSAPLQVSQSAAVPATGPAPAVRTEIPTPAMRVAAGSREEQPIPVVPASRAATQPSPVQRDVLEVTPPGAAAIATEVMKAETAEVAEPSPADDASTAPEVWSMAAQVTMRAAPRAGAVAAKTSVGTGEAAGDPSSEGFAEMVVTAAIGDVDGTAEAAPVTSEVARAASTPLGLLEGSSGVEAAEAVEAVRREARPTGDGRPRMTGADASASMRTPLTAEPAADSMTARETLAPASEMKASAMRSLPVAAQVAETVRAAVLRGEHEVRLLLNPGDLGQIDIRITEQGGLLRLHLGASRGSTRELIAREMPVLQLALESRDLRVERIQVSHSGSASADGSGAAWQQGSGRQGFGKQDRDGAPAWSPVAALGPSDRPAEARRAPRVIRHHGVLDRVA